MSIILRKVRGISGATALIRRNGARVFSASATAMGGSAALISRLLLVVVAIVGLLAMFLASGHGAGSAHVVAMNAHTFLGGTVIGSLAVKIKEKQDQISAKQKTMHDVFEAAGEDVDFSKPTVLTLVGAKDSKEAVEKVRALNTELDSLGKERDGLAELKTIQDENERRKNAPARVLPFPGGEGGDPTKAKRKGLGQLVIESEAFTESKKTKGSFSSIEQGYGLSELKTVFSTGAGWSPESLRVPGLIIEKATRPIQVLDIIPSAVTGMAAVKYMEETTRTHAEAERAEAAVYAEDTFALTERSSTVRSIGGSIPVTDEQLEDVEGVQSYLDSRLQFGCRQRLDGQVIIGDGTGVNLTGVKNVGGIQTQAKGADPAPDAIYKAMVLVRVTGRAFPNAVVIHPNNWQTIRLLRTADGVYIWGSPSDAGIDRIWGIQAVQSDADAAGTAYIGDYANFCALYERRGMEVAVGYVNDDFLKGKRTIRAGVRVAFVVYRPAAFCTVTGLV